MDKKDLILECTKEIEESIDFEFFKTLFDPVRCDIIKYLAINGANNIKDISENFAQDRSVISRHLDLMHRHGIVNKTKENRSIFYELNDKYILEKFELTATNLKKINTSVKFKKGSLAFFKKHYNMHMCALKYSYVHQFN